MNSPEETEVMDIDEWQGNLGSINLLLTRRCNFECNHCMYESGTHFRGYMSNEILWAIHDQVLRLQEFDLYPRINLIGGEPTLNLDRFAEILDLVSRWDVPIEMTTNGWWLARDETASKFFDIVTPYIDSEGMGIDGNFSVRISNDQWHDQFRPDWLMGNKLTHALEELWDYSDREVFYRTVYYCCECGEVYNQWLDECPKCEAELEAESELLINRVPPKPSEGDPWINVQDQRRQGYNMISPVGRAEGWGEQEGCSKYSNAYNLSYLPNGKLMDICCKGAWCEFGTVYDDPLLLLELGRVFTERVKPYCSECRDVAKEWKRDHLATERKRIIREIERLEEE